MLNGITEGIEKRKTIVDDGNSKEQIKDGSYDIVTGEYQEELNK